MKYANFLQENFAVSKKKCNFAAAKLKCVIMNIEETKQELRAIVEKPAKNITGSERDFLTATAEALGVVREGKKNCAKCWHELAMQCWLKLQEDEQPEADGRAYVLRKGVDVIFGGIRINEATITDDLARKVLARGFERKYFVKCE